MDGLKDIELKQIVKELRVVGRTGMRKAAKIEALHEMGIFTLEDLEIIVKDIPLLLLLSPFL